MTQLIDMHNHILPGVDDGSKDMDMSIKMLHIAASEGITSIILTPHNKPNHRNVHKDSMSARIEELRRQCELNGINIEFYTGNEVFYRSGVIDAIEEGRAMTMAGSMYVLLEFTPETEWDYVRRGVYEVVSGGYTPIVAHVERYNHVMKSMDRVYELCDMGAHLQVNASSVMGEVGREIKNATKKLLKQDLVDFIASDAHDDKKRTPKLADCAKYITKKYGADRAQKIFVDNPKCIIENQYIE